jgi:hypothetical protein
MVFVAGGGAQDMGGAFLTAHFATTHGRSGCQERKTRREGGGVLASLFQANKPLPGQSKGFGHVILFFVGTTNVAKENLGVQLNSWQQPQEPCVLRLASCGV